jgi:hypothetical protein
MSRGRDGKHAGGRILDAAQRGSDDSTADLPADDLRASVDVQTA